MSNDKLARIIDEAFEGRDKVGPKTKGAVRKAVNAALDLLDRGLVAAQCNLPGVRSACDVEQHRFEGPVVVEKDRLLATLRPPTTQPLPGERGGVFAVP